MARGIPLNMLLLDTCTLLWLTTDITKLSEKARSVINDYDKVYVSAISCFEIGLKIKKHILQFEKPLQEWWAQALQLHNLVELQISGKIAGFSSQLPDVHRDPADRLIVASALLNNLSIVTPDSHIKAYPEVKIIW